jgi:N-acetylglucosamine kinase-like BadF-type ATPase
VEPAVGKKHLHECIQAACAAVGGTQVIDTAFLGMGGVISPEDVQVVMGMVDGVGLRPDATIGVDVDIAIALAGGTGGQPGIALIVGTGTSCFGRNAAGESWRSGGWGYIIDDYGSGFFLGQKALEAVIRAADGRAAITALTDPVMAGLGITDMNQVMHRIYYPRLDHTGIAALAPIVVSVAEAGDPAALDIIRRGCDELALMVATVTAKLSLGDDVLVVPVGSLGTVNAFYRGVLHRAIAARLPAARVRDAVAPAVIGAGFLALQQVGITLPQETLASLANAV